MAFSQSENKQWKTAALAIVSQSAKLCTTKKDLDVSRNKLD